MNLKYYKIHEFVKCWLSEPDWWFSKKREYDEYITKKYEYLLDDDWSNNQEMHNILNKDNWSDEEKALVLGYIIIYDQLPRHVFRNECASHIIDYFLQKCLKIIKLIDESFKDNLNNLEWTFFMLPIRHTKIQKNVFNVMKLTWKRMENNEDRHLKRFLRATFLNCPTEDQKTLLNETSRTNKTLKDFASILDGASHISFNNTNKKPVKIDQLGTISQNDSHYSQVRKSIILDKFISPKEDIKNIVVSLSGGVDSMVTLDILRKNYPNINISCVHINYANRPTSYDEASFVNWWCYKNNIKLYTRHITEINRSKSNRFEMRDTYELYTKNVRFGCYKSVYSKTPIVALGHNKDDCFENIMTNITSKCKYDNLNGMDIWSNQDNITFYRPLLNISKSEIIEYAHKNNIPYLYNSTSVNCQRGKIRNEIVPVLNNWNPRSIEGMHELSDIMRELYANTSHMIKIWLSRIDKNNSIIGKINDIPESLLFWKELLLQAFNSRPSKKSISNFINKINSCKTNYDKLFLNEKITVILNPRHCFNFIKKPNGYIILQFIDSANTN